VLVALQGALWNQFGWGADLSGFPPHRPSSEGGWPLEAIVATIRRTSPHQLSTLAVLPDHEFLNAFNLDAEGRRQHDVQVVEEGNKGIQRPSDSPPCPRIGFSRNIRRKKPGKIKIRMSLSILLKENVRKMYLVG
jgi:hypothetical protein